LYADNFNNIKPIDQRNNDLIHIGRLDRGKRSVYINQLKKLPIKFINYGRSKKNQILSPIEEVIVSARDSKLGICFTEPNHERSFTSNNKLWEFKVHNKSSFTQLLYSGCVVISEYQPYVMKNFIPNIHFVLLKNNNIEKQILELLTDQYKLQSIQNNLKKLFDKENFLKKERERFNSFLENIHQTKSYNENFVLSTSFKFNFIKFNRNKFKSLYFRRNLKECCEISMIFIVISLLLISVTIIYHRAICLLQRFFTFKS
jgi:predicted RNA-binding protein with RPS1 domain